METLFNKILEVLRRQESCATATIVASRGSCPRKIGAKMVVHADGSVEGTIGGGGLEKLVTSDALAALRRKRSFLKEYPLHKSSGLQVCGGAVSVFIEVLEPARTLVICGAGHIGLSLSVIGKLLGFRVVVVDNRREFADKKRFPHADEVIRGKYPAVLRPARLDKSAFVVIVTHAHLHDTECLRAALKTGASYIGMIGSSTKIALVFKQLEKEGVSRKRLNEVHTPVGLKIGAETPEEIAVSIAAELVQVYRKGRDQKVSG